MRQTLRLEGGDTAASGKVFLAKLYPLRARGPSPLDLIAQPLLFSSYIPDFSQERGNNLQVPAMATPAAGAISFNHHDTEVGIAATLEIGERRHWQARQERSRGSDADLPAAEAHGPPITPHCLGTHSCSRNGSPDELCFPCRTKSQAGAKSPWVKTAVHHRFWFVLLIHLKGNLVSNQN